MRYPGTQEQKLELLNQLHARQISSATPMLGDPSTFSGEQKIEEEDEVKGLDVDDDSVESIPESINPPEVPCNFGKHASPNF